jgi:uncharacterized phage protein gp47/JayE
MEVSDLVWIDETGYHYADYATFLQWRKEQYQAIYGADVYLEPDSQDGQLLAIQAKADYDFAAQGASTYNSFSPASAQGVGLSRVVRINGISRRAATYSTVDLDIGGTVGTTIINGVAKDSLEQKWNLPPSVVIPMAGTISVTATADQIGAVSAQANTITSIFTPTLGWQTVNNPSAATVGVPVETDAELRARQAVSTANPSLTVLEGTVGGVENVTGVTKVRGYENDTGVTDGNGLPPHSISLVVLGGSSVDVAQEIQLHKTPGTETYGTTSEIVYDSHLMPLEIKFYRPTLVTITIDLTITIDPVLWSSDYETLIKQEMAAYINGLNIGETVLITKLYAPAYLNGSIAGQSYDVDTLEIGKNLDPPDVINIPIDFNELAVCDPDTDISITVA